MRRFALKLTTWTSCIVIAAGLAGAQTPSVPDGGVVNAASYAKNQAVSPGALVAIFGTELASGTAFADSVPLSTSRLDVKSVTFNGVPAPLHFISAGQINAQLPWNVLSAGVVNGTANLVVNRASGSSTSTVVQVTQAAPGIFSIPPGAGYAVAINPDGTLAAPVGAITGTNTRPAKVGEVVVILASGLGAVDSPIANGANSLDKTRHAVIVPGVFFGGQAATVQFAGLSPEFVGVNQINATVPSVTAGDHIPLQLDANGIRSTDQVVVAVAAP